jgi:hypothetical protein
MPLDCGKGLEGANTCSVVIGSWMVNVQRIDYILLIGMGITVAALLIARAIDPELAESLLPGISWIGIAYVIRFALWPRDRRGNLQEPPPRDPPTQEDIRKGQLALQRLKVFGIVLAIPVVAAFFVVAFNSPDPVAATLPLLGIAVLAAAIWQFRGRNRR